MIQALKPFDQNHRLLSLSPVLSQEDRNETSGRAASPNYLALNNGSKERDHCPFRPTSQRRSYFRNPTLTFPRVRSSFHASFVGRECSHCSILRGSHETLFRSSFHMHHPCQCACAKRLEVLARSRTGLETESAAAYGVLS